MCQGNGTGETGLTWLLPDHLGSTSTAVQWNGSAYAAVSEMRYKAFGETRYSGPQATPTTFRYTGQREEADLGIYYYNARWYDPALGRFLRADTIIPSPYNPLDWDRYAYVRNNPVRYSDPTGHKACESDYHDCDWKSEYLWIKAGKILDQWGGKDDLKAMVEIVKVGAKLYGNFNILLPKLTEVFMGSSKIGPGALIAAVQAGGCGGIGREPRDCKGNTTFFSDTGFHSDFQDGHNQIYHVWGYIAETSAPGNPLEGIVGQLTGTAANIIHEVVQSILGIDEGWGTSWQDYVLSEMGMQIGALITDQKITPSELATVLSDRLSIAGPGSRGRLQELQSKFPPLLGDPR